MNEILNSRELVGTSPFCQMVRRQVPLFASYDLPVLIMGDTGTGKDVIARMIHDAGKRADKIYLSMNCSTLGSLAESELFGHVSGAFTGAVRGTRGFVGSADGGTLLLDEIGEIPLEIQAKLLRFLDNGEYYRVGESTPRKADVRIIAATNQDLEQLCRERKFREDLYYRLSGAVIRTVPLADRVEDIPLLVKHFIKIYARHTGVDAPQILPEAMDILVKKPWPGNVRQLKHAVFRICHFSDGGSISAKDVEAAHSLDPVTLSPGRISPGRDCISTLLHGEDGTLDTYRRSKQRVLTCFDKVYFQTLLSCTGGGLKDSLRISGLHKKNFYTKLKVVGLTPSEFRKGDAKSLSLQQ
ncbi:sigma 54-interacting transcriptional regulator [Desulfolithobacter sp.]